MGKNIKLSFKVTREDIEKGVDGFFKKFKKKIKTSEKDQIVDLIISGVLNPFYLFTAEGLTKEISDILAEYKIFPEDDEPEVVQSAIPGFNFGSFFIDADGNVGKVDSSTINPQPLGLDEVKNIILSNETIKELDVTGDDINIINGMIILSKRNNNDVEMFRLDIYNNDVYIQAPLATPLPNYQGGTMYTFAAIPLDSDLGKEVINGKNYVININDIDKDSTIFRDAENAA